MLRRPADRNICSTASAYRRPQWLMTVPPAFDSQLDHPDPRSPYQEPHVGRARRRRRRIITSTMLLSVVGLLLGNAAMVSWQDADATGNSTLPLDGGNIYVSQGRSPQRPGTRTHPRA